jgi:hypothetical protein
MPDTFHGDERNLSLIIGGNVRAAGQYGCLTEAIITAATSNQDLQDDLLTATALLHGDVRPAAIRFNRAIAIGNNPSFNLENADVTGSTTVESLADNTANTDATAGMFDHFLS